MEKYKKYLNDSVKDKNLEAKRKAASKFDRQMQKEEEDPQYMFQGKPTKLVGQIATGKINAQEWAKEEMASRGLDKRGNWVGFEEARKIWKPKVKSN